MEGDGPAGRAVVERLALAQRPVELRLEWVEDHVDLVEHEHARLQLLDDVDRHARLCRELRQRGRAAHDGCLRCGALEPSHPVERVGVDPTHVVVLVGDCGGEL